MDGWKDKVQSVMWTVRPEDDLVIRDANKHYYFINDKCIYLNATADRTKSNAGLTVSTLVSVQKVNRLTVH